MRIRDLQQIGVLFLMLGTVAVEYAVSAEADTGGANPYASPAEASMGIFPPHQNAADALLAQLEGISLQEPTSRYRSAETILAAPAGWFVMQPTSTMPGSWNDYANPLFHVRRARRNRGVSLIKLDSLVRAMDRERLQRLDPYVAVPLLTLSTWDTLEELQNDVARGHELSQWSRTVNAAQIMKAANAQAGQTVTGSTHIGKKTLGSALVSVLVFADTRHGVAAWVNALPEEAQVAAVFTMAYGLFGITIGTYYWDRLRNKHRAGEQAIAGAKLKHAIEYANEHDLPAAEAMRDYWAWRYTGFTKSRCHSILSSIVSAQQ